MTIHVDADACPVRDAILEVARARDVPVVFYASMAHVIPEADGARVVRVDNRSQEVDLRIANASAAGDVVVTGDFGLASMCLARRATVIGFRGEELSAERLPAMLEQRHADMRVRRGGGRTRGPSKLSAHDVETFRAALERTLA